MHLSQRLTDSQKYKESRLMTYIFYISNHGFGHIMREIPVMARLLECGMQVICICGAKQLNAARSYMADRHIIDDNEECGGSGKGRFVCLEGDTDYGTPVIPGTLKIDARALERGVRTYVESFESRIEEAVGLIKRYDAAAVICDIVPWALTAAKRAGVPSFFMASFTWIEVFEEYLDEKLLAPYRKCFEDADRVLLYAMANEPTRKRFPDGIQVGLAARPFDCERVDNIRRKLSCGGQKLVFMSVGGSNSGIDTKIDVNGLPYRFVATGGIHFTEGSDNVYELPEGVPDTNNYIAACDYCITKPGWSTIAEVLLAGTPAALIGRPDIAEDRMNIAMMCNLGAAVSIDITELDDMSKVMNKISAMDYHRADFVNDYEHITGIIMGQCDLD